MDLVVPRQMRIQDFPKPGTVSADGLQGVAPEGSQRRSPSILTRSGGGRSAPTNVIGLPGRPRAGLCFPDGRDVPPVKDRELPALRIMPAGFAFQSITLPGRLAALKDRAPVRHGPGGIRRPVREMPEKACTEDWPGHGPDELPGRQRQRAASAGELAEQRLVALAGEPTGGRESGTVEDVTLLPVGVAIARCRERQTRIRGGNPPAGLRQDETAR